MPTLTRWPFLLSQFKAVCSPPGSPSQYQTGAHCSQLRDHCWHRPPAAHPPAPPASRPAGSGGSPGAASPADPDIPGSAGPAAVGRGWVSQGGQDTGHPPVHLPTSSIVSLWAPLLPAAVGPAAAQPPGGHAAASGPPPAVRVGKGSAEGARALGLWLGTKTRW